MSSRTVSHTPDSEERAMAQRTAVALLRTHETQIEGVPSPTTPPPSPPPSRRPATPDAPLAQRVRECALRGAPKKIKFGV